MLDLQKCSMIPLWTRASNFTKGLLNAFSQLCKEIVFNPSVDRITCKTSELLVNTQEWIKHAFLWTFSGRLRYIVSGIFFEWFKTLMEFLENLLQPSTFLSLQHLRNKLKTKVIFWFDSKISTKCIWKYVFSYPDIVGCFFPASSLAAQPESPDSGANYQDSFPRSTTFWWMISGQATQSFSFFHFSICKVLVMIIK